MNISAAIVTYNRLDFLKKLIIALNNQSRKPDRIIVVNNSSTDGTSEFLETCDGIEVITQPNWGSSGGQFTSAKYCYETGSEWIWLMDDDVIPRTDALKNLLAAIDENRIHVPLRLNPDGKVNQGDTLELNYSNPFKSIWKRIIDAEIPTERIIPAEGITFEGPLFHRNLITDIGLPEFGFFIYADDTDFFSRAVKKGYKSFIISNAVSDRLLPVGELGRFDWKTYYMIRNQIALDVLNAPFEVRVMRPFGYLISWLSRAKGLSEYKTVLKAFFDGYFYKKHDKNIEFDLKING
ncbi:MAG: glycosyltransferase [Candidatus Kapabacteria bacterium]|nr:glycosyltransferase [Ignavibacteriota bacterium]MCW5884463.1 glycosyltransferase [Candidatus Kapabacteria bacterium]